MGLGCAVIFILVSCSKKQAEPQAAPPVAVKFEEVKAQSISQEFTTAGELKADREILVSAEIAGQIEAILVKEGEWIREGQILVRVKGDDAKADLAKAKSDYESFLSLYEQGAISKRELLQYETLLKKAEAVLDHLNIKALISGTVGEIYVDPGDFTSQGSKIMDLVKSRPLRVSYSIPEKLIPLVKLGQPVEINTEAYPNQVFTGFVDFIAPKVDTTSRTVLVRAQVDDPKAQLKVNQFVEVKQKIKKHEDALLVKEESVYLDQGQEYLYLARPSDKEESYKAERVAIKTGLRQISKDAEGKEQARVEIVNGIQEGDLVIYAGLHSIYPGAELLPIESVEK